MYILWCLVLQPQVVSPPQSPWTLLKSTRLLSLLLNAKLFPTSGFCTCYFLCLECVSFCFSHDWVFLILQILTEMSLPQQSLSWLHCLKLISPVTLSLYPISFIVLALVCNYTICSLGYLLLRATTMLPTPWVQGWHLSSSLCFCRTWPSVCSHCSVVLGWIITNLSNQALRNLTFLIALLLHPLKVEHRIKFKCGKLPNMR